MSSRLLAATLLAALALLPPTASASISQVQQVDGPNADVLELGGVAMAEDGTGGLVYRRREGGRPHVFVARFFGGRWQPAQRVDAGQGFESSWPAIGAADGGRLVAVWVQEFGVGIDRLFSATLDPGATRFQPPVAVDLNVGEATAVFPSLAMNRGGAALLSYRVITDPGGAGSNLPPGYVMAETRLARYNGFTWSGLGQLANRSESSPVRTPDAGNSPKVAIDNAGAGVMAFQEPDDEFIDRVWARRVFGSVLGMPLIASPQSWENRPLRGAADAFSLDMADFGLASVAFRQQPGQSSALEATRVMTSMLPEAASPDAGKFAAPRIVDGASGKGPASPPGVPSVAVAPGTPFLAGFSFGGAAFSAGGDDRGLRPVQRLDTGGGAADPVVDLGSTGAVVAAWKLRSSSRAGISVREVRADGVPDTRVGSAARGGAVNDLRLAGSGLGDALVAFHQGGATTGQVAAVTVDAPPAPFLVQTPTGWVRGNRSVPLTWDQSFNAIGPVSYEVSIDDERVVRGLAGRRFRLPIRELDDGVLEVRIVATDRGGQRTTSGSNDLKVDRTRPRVRIRGSGRRVTVIVSDGRRNRGSGVSNSTRVSWGDGRASRTRRGRAVHVYGGGAHRLVVRARDRAGNRTTVSRRVP